LRQVAGIRADGRSAPRRARDQGLSRNRGRDMSETAPAVPDENGKTGTPTVSSSQSMLSLKDVSVARGGRPVVRKVSIDIPAGEVTALLGPNGVGKSSLVLSVGGVIK